MLSICPNAGYPGSYPSDSLYKELSINSRYVDNMKMDNIALGLQRNETSTTKTTVPDPFSRKSTEKMCARDVFLLFSVSIFRQKISHFYFAFSHSIFPISPFSIFEENL